MMSTMKAAYGFINTYGLFLSLAYVVLVILPFYARGLHQEPASAIYSGRYDPAGMNLYGPASITALLVYSLPIVAVILVIFLVRTRIQQPFWRRVGYITLLCISLLSVFVFVLQGSVIQAWILD